MIHQKLNTIFVHTPRGAGTAIRKRLNEIPGAGKNEYYSHITANDYKIMLGEKYFNKCFKFSVVRNPYDRVYSSYKRKSSIDEVTFYDFEKWLLMLTTMDWKRRGVKGVLASHFYWLGEPNLMNFIIRYENFKEDWDKVCKILKIDNHIDVINVGMNNLGGYKKYHTKITREIVEKYFKKDLEVFNYAF